MDRVSPLTWTTFPVFVETNWNWCSTYNCLFSQYSPDQLYRICHEYECSQCIICYPLHPSKYLVPYFLLGTYVSLIEFIIAQSPHTTKGLLIGVFYIIQFGVGGLLSLIQTFFCEYVHTGNMSCSKNLIFIIIVITFKWHCCTKFYYVLCCSIQVQTERVR